MTTLPEKVEIPASIQGKFKLSLVQSKFQELVTMADSLIYDEDHIGEITNFLKKVRFSLKGIEDTHKEGKAPAWLVCSQYDLAKRTFSQLPMEIEKKVQGKYSKLCKDIEEKKQKDLLEAKREKDIKEGIENNALRFASSITDCKTSSELTKVESLINLEKSRTLKYAEFIDLARDRFTELNTLVATQKTRVKELEKIAEQEKVAIENNNEEKIIELQEKKEEIQDTIDEAKIIITETVINQSLNSVVVEPANVVYPSIKARRSVFTWDVVDIKETAKKMPEWTEITPITSKIDEYLSTKKKEGITGEEFTFAGIRFYLKKTY